MLGKPSVGIVSIKDSSISLSWSIPIDSVVESYEVTWEELSNDGGDISTSGNITDTNYTIEKLQSTTIYNITVTVTNIFENTHSHPIIISTGTLKTTLWLYAQLIELDSHSFSGPNITDSHLETTTCNCKISQANNTLAIIIGGTLVAVVFTLITGLTVIIVIAILALRCCRRNHSTGTKKR